MIKSYKQFTYTWYAASVDFENYNDFISARLCMKYHLKYWSQLLWIIYLHIVA